MTLLKKKRKIEANQDIVNDYIRDGQPWPTDRRTIAAWAIRKRRWQPSRKEMIDRYAQNSRKPCEPKWKWTPRGERFGLNTAQWSSNRMKSGTRLKSGCGLTAAHRPRNLCARRVQQRRRKVLGECKQLKTDLDSYNDNNTEGAVIQMSFNFESDLEELAQDTKYNPPERPNDR